MKKTAIIAGAVFFCLSAVTVNAQEPDSTKQPVVTTPTTAPVTTTPVTTTTTTDAGVPVSTTTTALPYGSDKWNNWDSKTKYAMLPMPEALTTEKIFPIIGKYDVADKDGAHSEVTVALDETNKGIAWVDGLPQGRTKIYLRKSPAVYTIPAQKTDDGKDIAPGVLIFDKDANILNVCSNCKYNAEDPAVVFLPADQQPVVEEQPVVKSTKKTKTTKVKVKEVKPTFYTGTKVIADEQVAPVENPAPATTTPVVPQQ